MTIMASGILSLEGRERVYVDVKKMCPKTCVTRSGGEKKKSFFACKKHVEGKKGTEANENKGTHCQKNFTMRN